MPDDEQPPVTVAAAEPADVQPAPETPATDTAPAAPADPAPPVPTLQDRILTDLNRWMIERIYGSPVSQSTPAFNHLSAELPALAERLAALVT